MDPSDWGIVLMELKQYSPLSISNNLNLSCEATFAPLLQGPGIISPYIVISSLLM